MNKRAHYDVVIVGGGPAGLSAALVLGRCRRRVALYDAGRPRNYAAREMHGFIGRDCSDPAALRRDARAELARYGTVELHDAVVKDARAAGSGFDVELKDGGQVTCRKLLLATGVTDELPSVPGMEEIYGASAHHCPYCDGYEWRDRAIAVYGQGEKGKGLALEMLGWSHDVVLFTNGPAGLTAPDREELGRNGIRLVETGLAAFASFGGMLRSVQLASGETIARDALFFYTPSKQSCKLAESFGCQFDDGLVNTGEYEQAHMPGLYVAGDASRNAGFAIVAAAEGARAAFAINCELLKEDRA